MSDLDRFYDCLVQTGSDVCQRFSKRLMFSCLLVEASMFDQSGDLAGIGFQHGLIALAQGEIGTAGHSQKTHDISLIAQREKGHGGNAVLLLPVANIER